MRPTEWDGTRSSALPSPQLALEENANATHFYPSHGLPPPLSPALRMLCSAGPGRAVLIGTQEGGSFSSGALFC